MSEKAAYTLSVAIVLAVIIHGLFFSNHYTIRDAGGIGLRLDQRSGEMVLALPYGANPIKNSN